MIASIIERIISDIVYFDVDCKYIATIIQINSKI